MTRLYTWLITSKMTRLIQHLIGLIVGIPIWETQICLCLLTSQTLQKSQNDSLQLEEAQTRYELNELKRTFDEDLNRREQEHDNQMQLLEKVNMRRRGYDHVLNCDLIAGYVGKGC